MRIKVGMALAGMSLVVGVGLLGNSIGTIQGVSYANSLRAIEILRFLKSSAGDVEKIDESGMLDELIAGQGLLLERYWIVLGLPSEINRSTVENWTEVVEYRSRNPRVNEDELIRLNGSSLEQNSSYLSNEAQLSPIEADKFHQDRRLLEAYYQSTLAYYQP